MKKVTTIGVAPFDLANDQALLPKGTHGAPLFLKKTRQFTTLDLGASGQGINKGFITSADIIALVEQSTPDAPLFLVRMYPLHDVGLLCYTSSSNDPVMVPCVVVQTRHRVADGHKIELLPTVPGFGKESMYLMDLATNLRTGSAFAINQNAPDIEEPTGFSGLMLQAKQRCSMFRYRASTAGALPHKSGQPTSTLNKVKARFSQLFGDAKKVRFDG